MEASGGVVRKGPVDSDAASLSYGELVLLLQMAYGRTMARAQGRAVVRIGECGDWLVGERRERPVRAAVAPPDGVASLVSWAARERAS